MTIAYEMMQRGGKLIRLPATRKGSGPQSRREVWNFGYVPRPLRTEQQNEAVHLSDRGMPKFAIEGIKRDDPKRVMLADFWKHPLVKEVNGYEFTGVHQITGSCVGAGGGNAVMTVACVEAVIKGDPEIPLIPFWLLPYGRSRFYLGDHSPGEGSTGSTFAKAIVEDGDVPANSPGLPTFTRDDGFVWGQQAEMKWSDGDNPDTMRLLPESRKNTVKTAAKAQNADDMRDGIRSGYPGTAASMYAHDGGKVQGTPPVLLARKQGSWSHQMSVLGWWEHPQFGELFYLMNQWGLRAHGSDPSGGPAGGVWITKADMDWICRDEVYIFSDRNGYPAREVPLDFRV